MISSVEGLNAPNALGAGAGAGGERKRKREGGRESPKTENMSDADPIKKQPAGKRVQGCSGVGVYIRLNPEVYSERTKQLDFIMCPSQ